MTASTEQERALASLRHLYEQMVQGAVKDSAQAKHIAEGLLSPAIARLEQASRRAQVVPQGWRLIPEDATEEWLTVLREKGVRIGSFESLLTDVLAAAPKPPEAAKAECWCLTCRPLTLQDMRFVICPDCGNKRCPKANNHANACTNSNAPGQKGSSWEHVKPIAEAAPVQLQESISKVLEDCRSRAIDYATCPSPYNNTRMETAFQSLEHQVRQLLAAHAHGIGKDKA